MIEEQAKQPALEAIANITTTCSQNPELTDVRVFMPGAEEQGNRIEPKRTVIGCLCFSLSGTIDDTIYAAYGWVGYTQVD